MRRPSALFERDHGPRSTGSTHRLVSAAAKRARSREQPLPNPRTSSVAGLSRLDQWLARSQTSPSLAAMRHERAVLLSEALARLPEDSREVLVLRHLEGLGFPEVGERM